MNAPQTSTPNDRPLVLVTGCSGFIGSRTVAAMCDGYRVVGLDIKPPDEMPGEADFIECDLTCDEDVNQAIKTVREKHGGNIASVIHLAAYYDFSGEPSPMYDELTVNGTKRLLLALRQDGIRCEQVIFSSSLLVMHPAEEGSALTEDSPTEARWEYPESKLKAEEVLQKFRGDIPAISARVAGLYNEDCHSLPIAQQVKRIYEEELESYFFPGDADHGQSFVHLEDVVSAFQAMVSRRDQLTDYENFLIGEPSVLSYGEMQEQIGLLLHGERWPTLRIPKIFAKVGAWAKDKIASDDDPEFIKPWMVDMADEHYPVDASKAHRMLDWQPQHRLADTLPEMMARLKDNPRRWYLENGLVWAKEKQ